MIPYVALLATDRDGVAVLPSSCVAALRLAGTRLAGRHEAGAFACATAAADGESHGIRVDDQAIVVGDARLDGRDDLRIALGARLGELDDLGLIVAAYRRWGGAAVDRLRGDFSIAIWDRRERAVIAARDGLGVRPLYYAEVSGGVIVSNMLNAIRGYPRVEARLNDAAVASFLHLGWNADLTTTTFAAIRRLAPGFELRCGQGRGGVVTRRHWTMPDPEPVEFGREDEYTERYRDLLARAVTERVDPKGTLLFLSGGMDSITIAVSARRAVPDANVSAFTWRNAGLEGETESRLAADVAARYGMPHQIVHEPPIDALAPHAVTPEPVAEPELARLASLIGVALKGTGARVAIEGEDGDALFTPPSFAAMLRREPASRVFGRALRFVIRERRKPYVGTWIGRRLGLIAPIVPDPVPDWMAPRARTLAESAAYEDGVPVGARPEAAGALTRSIWQGVHDSYSPCVTGLDLEYRWPLLDTRVIEFVFAIPAIPWCQDKLLARRAFAAELPRQVVERKKVKLPEYGRALVEDWHRRTAAERIALGSIAAEYVDVDRLALSLARRDDPDVVMAAWRALTLDQWSRDALA